MRSLSLFWLRLRKLFVAGRSRRHVVETIDGIPFLVLPKVLNPVLFRGGAFLARTAGCHEFAQPPSHVPSPSALDMGTGSGASAVFAARRGYRVVGVDLNPEAVRCARINVLLNGLEDRVEVRQGDLFEAVQGERFDLVLFNPPFYRGRPRNSHFDLAWRSEDVLERFAQGLPEALAPQGRALLLLSTEGEGGCVLEYLRQQKLAIQVLKRRHFGNEIMTVYGIRRQETTGHEAPGKN